MNETQVVELKPCPKCGKEPRIMRSLLGGFYVLCRGRCDCGTATETTREQAIRLWNEGQYES